MCRTGNSGPGSTHKIHFDEFAGTYSARKKRAWAAAEEWKKAQLLIYEKDVGSSSKRKKR